MRRRRGGVESSRHHFEEQLSARGPRAGWPENLSRDHTTSIPFGAKKLRLAPAGYSTPAAETGSEAPGRRPRHQTQLWETSARSSNPESTAPQGIFSARTARKAKPERWK